MSFFGGFGKSFSGSSFRCSYILQVHLVVSTEIPLEVPTEVAPASFFRSSSKISCVFFRVLHLKKFSGKTLYKIPGELERIYEGILE